ncbi:MAG: RidA family protein [Caldilineaceae bacterium]|nr:RidA family protein [Caldilineaceae bacterium]
MKRTAIYTQHAPAAVGPYSQAIRSDSLLFLSGQLGLDPTSGTLQSGLEAQTRQALANLRAVLAEAGTDFDHVVKTTIFLTDMADFAVVNSIYGEVFSSTPSARSTVAVAALPLGGLVEIEAIALIP